MIREFLPEDLALNGLDPERLPELEGYGPRRDTFAEEVRLASLRAADREALRQRQQDEVDGHTPVDGALRAFSNWLRGVKSGS